MHGLFKGLVLPSTSLALGRDRCWLRSLQGALLVYGLAFIWNTSFLIGGTRVFCLFEDAMISMRYAKNFAQGQGLLWNPGQPPVEGFTNFLWTLWMVPWHLMRIPLNLTSLPMQLTGLLCLLLNLEATYLVAWRVSAGSAAATVFALVCTAFYLPILHWSLMGMETGLMTLLTSLACASALEDLALRRFGYGPYLWLLVATLVRVDALVFLVGTGILLSAIDPLHRRRHLRTALGLAAGMAVLQASLRLWYYGDPLPNTYYLKMTGFPIGLRLLRGLWVAATFFVGLAWVFPLALWGFLMFADMELAFLPMGMFLILCAYSIYVGGDAWEFWGGSNRFITPAMPLLFVCTGFSLTLAARRWAAGLRAWARPVALASGLLTLAVVTPHVRVLLLKEKTLYVPEDLTFTQRGIFLHSVTDPTAEIAVASAGCIPYFSQRPCLDLLGKCDRHIAHLPMHVDMTKPWNQRFVPGHLKWDYAWTLGRFKPDIIGQAGPDNAAFLAWVKGYAVFRRIYFRVDSKKIHWKLFGPLTSSPAPR